MMGFSNTIATTPGMIGPVIVGYVVQNKLATEWHAVFYITSTIAFFGAVFYAAFASGNRQSWAGGNQQGKFDCFIHPVNLLSKIVIHHRNQTMMPWRVSKQPSCFTLIILI